MYSKCNNGEEVIHIQVIKFIIKEWVDEFNKRWKRSEKIRIL